MIAIDFNAEIIKHEQNLERFALSLAGNIDDAKDLVQDTYVKALLNKDKFMDHSNLKAWLYTILKNTFINKYRKSIREKVSVDHTPELYYLNQQKDSSNPLPDSKFSQEEIEDNIEKLDDDFKLPFSMHTSGYKYKEIADELDLKIGTVKSRIFFTRKKLMKSLQDYAA